MSGTVYDYFLRACSRSVEALDGVQGERISDDNQNIAIFWIEVREGRVAAARYRATTCTTLIGVCERLSELVEGLELSEVLALTGERIFELHPEIPEAKRRSAKVALAALQSAAGSALTPA